MHKRPYEKEVFLLIKSNWLHVTFFLISTAFMHCRIILEVCRVFREREELMAISVGGQPYGGFRARTDSPGRDITPPSAVAPKPDVYKASDESPETEYSQFKRQQSTINARAM